MSKHPMMSDTEHDEVFGPGRYYLCLALMSFPEGAGIPHGGDILFRFWRWDREPDLWHVCYRFRRYAGESNDPFDGKDKKVWYRAQFRGDQAFAEKCVDQFADVISGATGLYFKIAPPEPDVLWIRGDAETAFKAIVRANKPWMHMKPIPNA